MSCFINPEKLENYKSAMRQKLANSLRAKVEAGESIDVVTSSKEMYNFFKEREADEALAQDAAAVVPFLIDQLVTNSKDLATILKKADPEIKIKIARIMVDYEKDINNVKRDLGIVENIGQDLANTQKKVELSKAFTLEQKPAPKEISPTTEFAVKRSGFVTTGREIIGGKTKDGSLNTAKNPVVKAYFALKRAIIKLFGDTYDTGKQQLIYNDEIGAISLRLVSGSSIPKSQRSDDEYDQTNENFNRDVYAVVVDSKGNRLFINEDGTLSKEGTKIAYFQIAAAKERLDQYNAAKTEEAKKNTDVYKYAQFLVKERNLPESSLKSVLDEVVQQTKDMVNIASYINQNPAENFIAAEITSGSQGHTSYGKSQPIGNIKVLNQDNFRPNVQGIYTTFTVPGSDQTYTITAKKLDTELANKFAELLTSNVYQESRAGKITEVSVDKKLALLNQLVFLNKKGRREKLSNYISNITDQNRESIKQDITRFLTDTFIDVQLNTPTYTDFTIQEKNGRLFLNETEESYYDSVITNMKTVIALDSEGAPILFNSYLTFAPLAAEAIKISPQQVETQEVKAKEIEEKASEIALEDKATEKGPADNITKNEIGKDFDAGALFKRLTAKSINKKETSAKIARGLIWYVGGTKALEDPTFKKFLEGLSESEQKAIKEEAKANPNAHLMSKFLPFNVVLGMVNDRSSDAVASMSAHGITLYHYYRENGELDGPVSGDFTDIYHEAWHGFTQGFLTEEERIKLYKEASKMPGSFRDYKGNYVTFAKATPLQLEEYLAEDFRAYMLSGGKTVTKETPVKKTLFQKILNFLKNLFTGASVKDIMQSKDYNAVPAIKELYDKLRLGQLDGMTFDSQNIEKTFGILEKTATARNTEDINLNYEDTAKVVETVESLMSDAIDAFNNNKGFKAGTSLFMKNEDLLKEGYTYVKTQLTSTIIPALEQKLESAKTDVEKAQAQRNLRLAQWMLNNFGDIQNLRANADGKGVIAIHQIKSQVISFEDRSNFFEDINEEAQTEKGNKVDFGKGNEYSIQERADSDIHALLGSLHEFKGLTPQYNSLGVHTLVQYDKIWNKLARLLNDKITEENIYNALVEAAKTDGTIAHLLQKLGTLETKRLAESRLWGKFWQTFNVSSIPLIQVNIEESGTVEKRSYIIKIGQASAPYKVIGNRWDNVFRSRDESTPYIKKDTNGVNYLDLNAVVKDFKNSSGKLDEAKKKKFLEAIGIIFNDDPKLESELLNRNIGSPTVIFNRIKDLAVRFTKTGESIRNVSDIFQKYSELQGTISTPELPEMVNLYNKLQELEGRYSDDINNYAVTNAEGNTQYEQSLNNTMTIAAEAINKVNSYDELEAIPYMSFLSRANNTMIDSSIWVNSLFDMSKGGIKRPGAKLNIVNLSGVQLVSQDDNTGVSSAAADAFTKFIQDFHITLDAGKPELMRHADKGTSFSAYIDKYYPYDEKGKTTGNLYIDTLAFAKNAPVSGFDKGYDIVKNYINGELKRINKFKAIQDRVDAGETVQFDFSYLAKGQKFIMFESLVSSTKERLLSEKYRNKTLDEIFEIDSENNGTLKEDFYKDFENYFKDRINDIYKVQKKGTFIAPNYITQIQSKSFTATKTGLTRQEAVNAAVESFVFNNWIHNVESTIMLYGDVAQYNLMKEEFHKRNAGIASTGKIFRTNAATLNYVNSLGRLYAKSKGYKEKLLNIDGSYDTAVLEDNTVSSEYVEDIREALDKDIRSRFKGKLSEEEIKAKVEDSLGDYVKGMKEGDAQGWITFDAYRAFSILQGEWTDIQEDMYRKISNGETLDAAKTLEFFPVRKYQYWGNLKNAEYSAMAFHKFSLVPLIPTLTKDKKINALHNKMMNEGIDYALFQSGSKISTITTNGVADVFYKDPKTREIVTEADKPFTKNTVYLQFLKNQLDIAPEYKETVTFPTQMRKLIENGIMEGGVPITFESDKDLNERIELWNKLSETDKLKNEAYRFVKNYEGSVRDLTEMLTYELIAEADIKFEGKGDDRRVVFNPKLAKFLVKQLERQDLADHELDALRLGPDGKLAQDLSLSMFSDKLEKALNSIIVRRLVKQKFKGEGLIQVSGAGFEPSTFRGRLTEEEKEKYGTNDQMFYRRERLADGTYGKTLAAKGKIALQGDFVNLLSHPDVKALAIQADVIAEANEKQISPELVALNRLVKDENWLDKGDNRKMITIIGPRIPTQEHNSMEFLEVYEFLDPKAGNIVILPSEIVAKSGGDFDVDKITFMFPSIDSIGGQPVYAKVDKSVSKENIPTVKKQLKDQLNALYEERKKIEAKYETEFTEMKSTKAFNNLTSEEQAALTNRYKEYQEKKKIITERIDSLNNWKEVYTKALSEDYDSDTYDNLNRTEDLIYQENNNLEVAKANWENTRNLYKSSFRQEKVSSFWEKQASEVKSVNDKIAEVKTKLLGISKGAYENAVTSNMQSILQMPQNYLQLVKPNSNDILEPIAKDLEKLVADKNYKTVTEGNKKRIAGTTVFEYNYNLDKHQYNNVGKKVLGIFAVANTYNSIFNRIGLKLNYDYQYGVQRSKIDPITKKPDHFTKRIFLALRHNTLKDNQGRDVISLSHLKDVDNQNYVSSLISQLINGSVDVAKDAWLFLIQGNQEVGPILEFLIETGVPVKEAIYFVSQPIIRDYVKEQQKLKSQGAKPMGEEIQNSNFYRNAAIRKMISKLFRDEAVNTENHPLKEYFNFKVRKSYNKRQELLYNYTTQLTDTQDFKELVSSKNAEKNLKDNISSKKITDTDKALFLHFLEIEEMSRAIKEVKLRTNFDTSRSNSVYEAEEKMALADNLENNGIVPSDILERIKKDTPIGSFYVQPLQVSMFKDMFELKNNDTFSKFLKSYIKNNRADIEDYFGDIDTFIKRAKNALPAFIFQNEVRGFNIETINNYKGVGVRSVTGVAELEPVFSLTSGVFVRTENGNPVIYIDKAQLKQDYSNRTKLGGEPEYINGKLVSKPARVNNMAFNGSASTFYKFIIERELIRNMYSLSELEDRLDFQDALTTNMSTKKMLSNEDANMFRKRMVALTYEEMIRDMALDNSLNTWKLFQSNKSYADQFINLTRQYPELLNYSVVKNLKPNQTSEDVRPSMKNLVFADRLYNSNKLNIWHENLVELSDASKIQITASPEEKRRVAEFFDRMPFVAYMQSGINPSSSFSIMRAMPQERFRRVMIPAAARFMNNINEKTLDKFMSSFMSVNRNYVQRMRGADLTITNYNPEGDKKSKIVESKAEPLELQEDNMGNLTMNLTGKETKAQIQATIDANPDAIFIVEGSEKPALNTEVGQPAFTNIGTQVYTVLTKPTATTVYSDSAEQSARLEPTVSTQPSTDQKVKEIPNSFNIGNISYSRNTDDNFKTFYYVAAPFGETKNKKWEVIKKEYAITKEEYEKSYIDSLEVSKKEEEQQNEKEAKRLKEIESWNNENNIVGKTFPFNVGENEKGMAYEHNITIKKVRILPDGNWNIIGTNNVNGNTYDMITEPNGNVISYTRDGKIFKGYTTDEIVFGYDDYVKPITPTQPSTQQQALVSQVKPTIDLSKEWKGDLESRPVYTAEGINTMRTSAAKPNEHFGNPFSEAGYGDTIKVDSIGQAVQFYKDWLLYGELAFREKDGSKGTMSSRLIEKEPRRQWIIDQINQGKLDGTTLLYAGKLAARGQGMHPTALAEVVEELRGSQPQAPVISKGEKFKPGVNPVIKEQVDNLVEAINQARADGKKIAYVSTGIGQYMIQKNMATGALQARQSFIYLSEQLLKVGIKNPNFERVLYDPENQTGRTGKETVQEVQNELFSVTNQDVEDNLIECFK